MHCTYKHTHTHHDIFWNMYLNRIELHMHNALYLCHQPSLDSRRVVCLCHCVACVAAWVYSLNALLQYAFFNDIDFYYCFHCCWPTILCDTFFSLSIRKMAHSQHQIVSACSQSIIVWKSELIAFESSCLPMHSNTHIYTHKLTDSIWRKMREQILFQCTWHSVNDSHSSIIGRPK